MKLRKRGKLLFAGCIFEIFILILGSFAFAFLISSGMGIVSAVEGTKIPTGAPLDPDAEQGIAIPEPSPTTSTGLSQSIPSTKSGVTVLNNPSGSGAFSKIFGGAKETTLIPDKTFQYNPGLDYKVPVELGKDVKNLIRTEGGGGYVKFTDGTKSAYLNPEEFTAAQRAATTEGVKFTEPKTTKILGQTFTRGAAHLVQGLSWSILVAGAIQLIGTVAGVDRQTTNALSIAAFSGIMAGKGLAALSGPSGGWNIIKSGLFTKPLVQFGVGVLVAAAVFVLLYKKEKKQLISFQCLPFEPQIGGAKCEECNKDPFRPCSEYRCKSLGQACQLLNPGTNEEKCTWVNPKDVNSPIIEPWNQALKPIQYSLKYIPDNAVRPPARGVKIISGVGRNGCLPAFTPLEFGIATNEPSQCKTDYNHTSKFDEMKYYFGENNYHTYNHTQKMRLPSGNQSDLSPLLRNDGYFSLFVRCRDANGNENVDEYSISFCVDEGPDTTPPIIEGFSIPSGSAVTYNQQTVDIQAYINEPVECKWSRESKAYEDMENSMACDKEAYQINADLQYVCSANLTGIQNREENKFYFRCKDQPDKPENERNPNVQSTELILKGSQPLNILTAKPNQTIFGSTDIVPVNLEVETDDGAEEGKAICYYSPSGNKDSYITMFETSGFKHGQRLNLPSGNYKYYFRCVDAGGNAAETITGFSVFSDKQAPKVTRAYKQEGLKIVTDEDAECRYSLTSCNYNFNDGLKMIYAQADNKKNSFAEWKASNTYYVKCRDFYGNEPEPNRCSVVVSAIDLEKREV